MSLEFYLDNSASTPTDPEVAKLAYDMMCTGYGNPSSLHKKGFEAQLAIEKARTQVAKVFGCDTKQIVFTSSGTEANNLAICGLAITKKRNIGRMIVSTTEHSSVLRSMNWCEGEGWEIIRIAPKSDGLPDIEAMAEAVNDKTALVSCMAVGSETGAITDLSALSKAVKAKNPNTLVHCDAVQGFCRLPILPKNMGIDMVTASGHKISAPKGVGVLYRADGVRLSPLLQGGGQEQGLRPGTEHVPLICAMGLATEKMNANMAKQQEIYKDLRGQIITILEQMEGVCINSPRSGAPHILNISVMGYRSETLIHFLEEHGVYVSSGSACAKGSRSHVLTAMGLSNERIDSALRISFGTTTTPQHITAFTDALKQAMAKLAHT